MTAVFDDVRDLEKEIRAHNAMAELKRFGEHLEETPLDATGLRTFFASMGAFFWDIPGGILELAVRVCDDWGTRDRYEATAKGAYVLFADVDEFGLHAQHKGMLPTHHQLFRDLTGHLGISEAELQDPQYIVIEGSELGRRTSEYYRTRPIGESLGYHLASETTSNREFRYFLNGFRKHASHYGLQQEDDPVLAFFVVHTLVEPMHKSRARELIEIYAAEDPTILPAVRAGAMAFMDGFEELFGALNERIYGRRAEVVGAAVG